MISVENVGKLYTLKHKSSGERYTTLRDVITRSAAAPFRALFAVNYEAATAQTLHRRTAPLWCLPATLLRTFGQSKISPSKLIREMWSASLVGTAPANPLS